MKILMLCGYFEAVHQEEIGRKSKNGMENAANTFQKRLIAGFEQQAELTILSAPFIGAWPLTYRQLFFRGFEKPSDENHTLEYVPFNNLWAYRNISRTDSLKRAMDRFLKTGVPDAIVVYGPHTPFLEAAVYAKRKHPSIHIHLVVPDLPQYMNVSAKSHRVYDFLKKFDIQRFYRLNEQVGSYTILTEQMADVLQIRERPYAVVEAIAEDGAVCPAPQQDRKEKRIVFAGKLAKSYGIQRLLQAFEMLPDPHVQLHICGGGDGRPEVEALAARDNRVRFYGALCAEKAQELLKSADVLVNPRLNDDDYTKYSFPSKNLEYLMTGKPVVAHMLDGMPEIYRAFLTVPEDDSIARFRDAIVSALQDPLDNRENRMRGLQEYVSAHLSCRQVALRMMKLWDRPPEQIAVTPNGSNSG